jgi:hypothetical protein
MNGPIAVMLHSDYHGVGCGTSSEFSLTLKLYSRHWLTGEPTLECTTTSRAELECQECQVDLP